MLIGVLASVWCGLATSFDSLLAARAIQGFGFGPADSLAASVIGEIFFVHERGRAMVRNFDFICSFTLADHDRPSTLSSWLEVAS